MKRLAFTSLMLVLGLSACGGSEDSQATDTTVSTSVPATVEAAALVKYVAVTPPNEAKYLSALKLRESELSAKITESQQVEVGRFACDELIAGTTEAAHQAVTQDVETKLVSYGMSAADAEDLAPDIKNASFGDTFCTLG